jgi:hypothetical protein
VQNELSLTEPPNFKGIVTAKAPGVSAVQAKFEIECLGEASDTMLVWVAPAIAAVEIRNRDEKVEEPLLLRRGEARPVHAVGLFRVLTDYEVSFGIPKGDDGSRALRSFLPFIGPLIPLEIDVRVPDDAELEGGLYPDGDLFLQVRLSRAADFSSVTIREINVQMPMPELAGVSTASWTFTKSRSRRWRPSRRRACSRARARRCRSRGSPPATACCE